MYGYIYDIMITALNARKETIDVSLAKTLIDMGCRQPISLSLSLCVSFFLSLLVPRSLSFSVSVRLSLSPSLSLRRPLIQPS